ncbi:MAG TPA: FimV/HubP family polar landmark protein, partial [Steroidobacteraceae bacterium]|nr:FimV/HubP family polar landmark protein [Steroidobacteraceae bacterium]
MRLKVLSAAASLLVVLPGASLALGLGDIQLKSTLNAPLDAEIELIGATPEELAGLKVQMASRDEFARHGLEYPAFLTSISLRTVRSGDGRNLIRLSSSSPITEPFATLLVEANWARGRHLREYTVLLDPPLFTPPTSQAAPVAAAVTGGGERSGGIARPAAPAAPAPAAPANVAAAPAPASRPAASISGDSYEVRRGDTLSRIASGVVGSDAAEQRRAMIAIYRGNLSAFDGNINLLRSGAVLRLPDPSTIAAISPSEATAEVRRQAAAWQSTRVAGGAAAPAQDARLRLVPPAEASPAAPAAPSVTTPGAAAASQALQQRVAELERQLNESRRLLELRSAELAQLQAQAAAPAPATPPAAETPAAPPPAAEAPVTPPVAEAPAAPSAPAAATPAAPPGPSLVDRLKDFWYVPVGLIALLLIVLGLRKARARRENAFDRSLGSFTNDSASRDYSSDTLPLRKPNIGKDDESFLVEESGAHERPAFGGRTTRKVDVDEPTPTAAPQTADVTGLEQGDPLAEADFHMAYGLYDQAADLVRLAIQREPQRRDLKLKLLEVFFVWGNKEQFLQTARDLAGTREQSQPGEWEKVVIMGKQLAPDDALFAQSGAGAGAAGVDLNLEGGQNRIDFDLHGEPSVELSEGGVDLDLGAALGDQDPTGDAPVLNKDVLDFPLDDPSRGSDRAGTTATTRQMAQPLRDGAGDYAPTVQMAGPDNEGPTVEQPTLPGGKTIRQKV